MDRGEYSGIFSIPDLHEFPEGTVPSPYRTLYPVQRLPEGLRLVAVGWLDGPATFPTGPSDPAVVTRLLGLDVGFLILDGTRGYHGCYYCSPLDEEQDWLPPPTAPGSPWFRRPESSLSMGHHLIELEGIVYMCPALLITFVGTGINLRRSFRRP